MLHLEVEVQVEGRTCRTGSGHSVGTQGYVAAFWVDHKVAFSGLALAAVPHLDDPAAAGVAGGAEVRAASSLTLRLLPAGPQRHCRAGVAVRPDRM